MHRNWPTPMSVVGCAALAGFLLTSCGVPPAEEEGAAIAEQRAALTTVSCSIDLVRNTHTCAGIPAISFPVAPSAGKAVARITLSCKSSARIRTYYNSVPTGWVVNIGDSATNNGWGGDAATQSNDAEAQIFNQDLTVYASDYGQAGVVATHPGAAIAGSYNDFFIVDKWFGWGVGPHVGYHVTDSSNLFALCGEEDAEGQINYDIFAAFNRTISSSRAGTGCSRADIVIEYP